MYPPHYRPARVVLIRVTAGLLALLFVLVLPSIWRDPALADTGYPLLDILVEVGFTLGICMMIVTLGVGAFARGPRPPRR